MTIAFVTAMYAVACEARVAEIWARLTQLASVLPLHIVCSAKDAHRIPEGAVPYFCEFESLETYKIVSKTTGLPRVRSEEKDTKEFMILMNAKAEFLKIVKGAKDADHYFWIDAGIGKIFRDPVASYNRLATILARQRLPDDMLVIPGCWDAQAVTAFDALLTRVSWRFCGGAFVVPQGLVDLFYYHTLAGCEEIRVRSGLAIWEVNLWDFMQSRIPILWKKGDHNEQLFEAFAL
jgi:hypothetical protein